MSKSTTELAAEYKKEEDQRLALLKKNPFELKGDEKVQWHAILDKGRIVWDREIHQFKTKDELAFVPVHHGDDPTPHFKDVQKAMEDFEDLADLLKIRQTFEIEIQGNTKTPKNKL